MLGKIREKLDYNINCPHNGVTHSYDITNKDIDFDISTISYTTEYNGEIYIHYEREVKTQCKICGKTNTEITYFGSVKLDTISSID